MSYLRKVSLPGARGIAQEQTVSRAVTQFLGNAGENTNDHSRAIPSEWVAAEVPKQENCLELKNHWEI